MMCDTMWEGLSVWEGGSETKVTMKQLRGRQDSVARGTIADITLS